MIPQFDRIVQLLRHSDRHFRSPADTVCFHFPLVGEVLIPAGLGAVLDEFSTLCSGDLFPAVQTRGIGQLMLETVSGNDLLRKPHDSADGFVRQMVLSIIVDSQLLLSSQVLFFFSRFVL